MAGTTASGSASSIAVRQRLRIDLGDCRDRVDRRLDVLDLGGQDAHVDNRAERDELLAVAVEDRCAIGKVLDGAEALAGLAQGRMDRSARPVDEPFVVRLGQRDRVVGVGERAELGHVPVHPDLRRGVGAALRDFGHLGVERRTIKAVDVRLDDVCDQR